MFRVEVIGNLGADAEIKNDNGRTYCQFSVADTRRFTTEDGTEHEVTNWVSCFMRKTDSEIIKYLRKGTKVFVRGNADLRVFSSAKDRMMKAGVSINVSEIELVGGSSDAVPSQLSLPSGQVFPVSKFYWADVRGVQPPVTALYDKQGAEYHVDDNGFIIPKPQMT